MTRLSLEHKRREPGCLLVVHESPTALGGSENAMLLSVEHLRRIGWRTCLLHAGPAVLPEKVAELFDRSIVRLLLSLAGRRTERCVSCEWCQALSVQSV